MTNQEPTRCPSCDTANAAHATFCAHCGKPMGTSAAVAPSEMYTSAVGAADGSGIKGYMIGAVAVAAVLIAGGALFLLADADESDDTAGAAGSSPNSVLVTDPLAETSPGTVASVSAPLIEVPTTPALAATTGPPPTEAPTTVPPPPEPTAPPTTAPPATVPPTVPPAPAPTTVAVPTVSLSFAQAESFYRGYIATAINGDYNAAWSMLSSSDQADYERGFDQFVGFWRGVSFADVQRVESVGGSAGFQSLAVDMAYGQVDGDPTSLEVIEVDVNVRPDGSFQIFDYRYVRNQ
jgi:hypothetical protein